MRNQTEILEQMQTWAKANDNVRAMIMTSSRTNPQALTDVFSDYDIEVFVRDLTPYAISDDWLAFFGNILVHWPLKPTSFVENWITRLVIFDDALRIDFQISTVNILSQRISGPEFVEAYDNGYQVLLDKDGLLTHLPTPSYSQFITPKPSQADYDACQSDFWWDITYVGKSLWRDELVFAKYMLDSVIRFDYFEKMVEWYIGTQTNWTANPNKHGRWFKHFLDAETWAELESTFAGPSLAENWAAMFNMMALYRRLSQIVGQSLGYDYPFDLDQGVTAYLKQMQALERGAKDFSLQITGDR